MKTIILLLIAITALSQDTLFMSRLNDKIWAQEYSKLTQFDHITFDNGKTLSIGDKIQIGSASGINFEYVMAEKRGNIFWSMFLPAWFKDRESTIYEIRMCKGKNNNVPSIVLDNIDMNIIICNLQYAIQSGEVKQP